MAATHRVESDDRLPSAVGIVPVSLLEYRLSDTSSPAVLHLMPCQRSWLTEAFNQFVLIAHCDPLVAAYRTRSAVSCLSKMVPAVAQCGASP